MTNRTSQKTEEEMLDQTFANFDNEMTGSTEAPDQTQEGGAEAAPVAAKKSNNTMIFVGAGLAAVGIVGYMFLKPQMGGGVQQQPPVQAQQQQPQVQPPVEQNSAQQPQASASSPANAYLLNNQPGSQAPVATEPPVQAQVQPPVVQTPQVVASAPVATVAVEPQGTTITTPNAVVQTPVGSSATVSATVPTTPVKTTSQQDAIVDELSNRFDQQTREFKQVLDGVGSRVDSLEKDMRDQKDINQKVDARLTALEGGKVVKRGDSSESGTRKVVRKVSKPVVVKKVEKADDSVLVDKSTTVATKPVKVEKEVPVYQEFNVHSIYAGRVWLKNTDGSLSTFSNGDRLPSGELVKRVDDEKFEIVTDKRVIKKK